MNSPKEHEAILILSHIDDRYTREDIIKMFHDFAVSKGFNVAVAVKEVNEDNLERV